MEALKNAIATYTTQQIVAAIKQIGGGQVDSDARIVRAELFDVYEERMGGDACDELLIEMGMM